MLPHVAGRRLRHVKHARQIHRDDFVPFFGSDLEKVMANADAGIVDQHIDSAHDANRLVECGLHLLEVGNIGIEAPAKSGSCLRI